MDEGMKQLSGERRGESAVAEAVRRGRELKEVDGEREEKMGRGKGKGAAAKGKVATKVGSVAMVAKKDSGEDGKPRADSAPRGMADYNQPMEFTFISQTGREKDVQLERREERRAVREKLVAAESMAVKKELGRGTKRGGA